MTRHLNLTKTCSMDIQDTEKDYLFRVEVKDGDDVYISSLLHQGLPTGT